MKAGSKYAGNLFSGYLKQKGTTYAAKAGVEALQWLMPSSDDSKSTTNSVNPSDYIKILTAFVSVAGTVYTTYKASNAIAASAAPAVVDKVRGVDNLHSAAKYLADDSPNKKQEVYDMKTYLQIILLCIISLTLKSLYIEGAGVIRRDNKQNKNKNPDRLLWASSSYYAGNDDNHWFKAYLISYSELLTLSPRFWCFMPVRTLHCILTGAINEFVKAIGAKSNSNEISSIIFNLMQFVFFVDFTIFCLGLGGWTITATTVANLAVLFGYKIHETHHPEAVSVEQKAQADSIFRGLPASGQRIVSWLTSAPKRK